MKLIVGVEMVKDSSGDSETLNLGFLDTSLHDNAPGGDCFLPG